MGYKKIALTNKKANRRKLICNTGSWNTITTNIVRVSEPAANVLLWLLSKTHATGISLLKHYNVTKTKNWSQVKLIPYILQRNGLFLTDFPVCKQPFQIKKKHLKTRFNINIRFREICSKNNPRLLSCLLYASVIAHNECECTSSCRHVVSIPVGVQMERKIVQLSVSQ